MSRLNLSGQRVWLVGASSGIGAALAAELSARGARVAVSARRESELAQIADRIGGIAAPCDVTQSASVAAALATFEQHMGTPDLVIWCAGTWQQFDARDWQPEVFDDHLRVNLHGLNNVLAAVLPAFIARGSGHLVGVASVAGYRGLAGAEAYGATKAAQINLLESLRASLKAAGVRVTTVCPGFVRTPMTAQNKFPMPFLIDPDQAARAIADGLEARRVEIVFPLPMAVLMKVARVVPVRAWGWLTARAARNAPK